MEELRHDASRPPSCVVVADREVEAAWVSHCAGTVPASIGEVPSDRTVYVIDFPDTSGWSVLDSVAAANPGRRWTLHELGRQGELGRAVLAVSVSAG
jgi:hypothetical protein